MGEQNLILSSSPHVRSKDTVRNVMRQVLIALIPALLVGLYFFKVQAALVMCTGILSAVASEWIWQKATKQTVTINDLSAVITGLLLSFNLPATMPLWAVALGSAFSIIIVKQFFGGIGHNIVNPALAGRAFLLASYPTLMTTFAVDGVAAATPLAILKGGAGTLPSMTNAFIGNIGGCIGEISAAALLLGFAYLLFRKVITYHIPVVYIATVAVLTTVLGRNGFMTGNGLYEILVGGVMLGAIFMATDYPTTPMTIKGQIIFAFGCGLLTTIIRIYGGYPEGVTYSILIMNLIVPLIDKYVKPKRYGKVK